jgi:hypothetical protein
MIKRNLFFLGLLSLGLLVVHGCAQKITKPPAAAAPATEVAPPGESASASTETPNAAALPAPLPERSASTPAADVVVTKEKDAASAKQAGVAIQPLPSQAVIDTINKMNHHPRVRYLSRTAQYSYYVGGRLDAKYDINKNELVITNDRAASDAAVTCRYSNDGEMISPKKSLSPKVIGECNDLIDELTKYLSR